MTKLLKFKCPDKSCSKHEQLQTLIEIKQHKCSPIESKEGDKPQKSKQDLLNQLSFNQKQREALQNEEKKIKQELIQVQIRETQTQIKEQVQSLKEVLIPEVQNDEVSEQFDESEDS